MAAIFSGCGMSGRETAGGVVSNKDEKIVISVLAGQSTSDAGIEDMIDDVLAEKFPDIKLEWECVDWGDNFSSQLQGRIAAGEVPDIIIGKAQDVSNYAREGILAEIQIDEIDRIDEEALETVLVDDKVYGIPYNAWYQGVIYNKKIFDDLGMQVPTTLDELAMVVDTCEEKKITAFASHFQESWKIANMSMQFFVESELADNPEWGDMFRKEEIGFQQNQVMMECLQQNQYILEHTWSDAATIDQYESDKRFAEGQAAMYLTGTWSLQSLDQYTDEDGAYGIFPYPIGNSPKLIKEINMTLMMSNSSKYQKEVQAIFSELFSNQELMQEILGFTQTYSVVDGIDSGYQSSIQEDVDYYEGNGLIVGADKGNNQLVWDFQIALADETQKWLNGEKSLEYVLSFADKNRMLSGN